MFILFMDRKGILLTHAVPRGQTVNSEYYSKVLRRDLVQALRKKRPYLAANIEQVILHQDIAPAHTSLKTNLEIDLLGFECLKHPPYSPDLAPMDFAVFPHIKSFLRGQRFDDLPELRQEVMNIILKMKTEQFEKIFDDWLKRCKKCVALKGDYVEKS
ncbi:SETMAR [Mytilus coruscus]|uniref:SETMAR n=1 Tax=Mytilus coruscus TaxID=42192 RepID=A0A6J8AFI7_MYTCO|nr:SETMAR [Mytilus coruscus]